MTGDAVTSSTGRWWRALLARSRSLRFRLLAISIALAVVGMAAVNLVAIVALRNNLLERVDAELRAVPPVSGTRPAQGMGPLPVASAQFLNNTVITRLDGGSGQVTDTVVGPLLKAAPPPDLSSVSAAIRSGAPLDEQPFTVGAVGDPGYTYRIRVLALSPAGSDVVVIAKSLADIRTTITRIAAIDAVLSGIVVAGLIGIGIPVIRVGLRPLRDVERAAERIAGGDLSVRAPHTDEPAEVGSLARTFNGMVDQIEGAFDAQQASEDQLRRFLADASHELRTPLTSIRAYAELFRQGALPAAPQSLQAMNRIEAEATRMSRLVEDLLLLARLDQHPELRTDRVDVAALVREVAADTAAAAPDHVVEVQVDHRAPPAGGWGRAEAATGRGQLAAQRGGAHAGGLSRSGQRELERGAGGADRRRRRARDRPGRRGARVRAVLPPRHWSRSRRRRNRSGPGHRQVRWLPPTAATWICARRPGRARALPSRCLQLAWSRPARPTRDVGATTCRKP